MFRLAPRIAAEEPNDWKLEQAERGRRKNFSTGLQLLMTETTNDPRYWYDWKSNSME